MCKIIRLYRHGETVWNSIGRLQGWLDSPLTVNGRALAKQVQWKPHVVVSSDLGRAVETAQLMFAQSTFHKDWRLREIFLGDWQGRYVSELEQIHTYQCYSLTPEQFSPSKQESFYAVAQRMQQAINELFKSEYEEIAVVSHGVAIACYLAYSKEGEFRNIWRYIPQNGQYIELTF